MNLDGKLGEAIRYEETIRIVSPVTLAENRYENDSEKMENFAIVVQGDSRTRQGPATANVPSMQ
jgi:hypothetical protein